MTPDEKSKKVVNCELNLLEIETIVNALAQEPYIKVAKLIQKFQEIVMSVMQSEPPQENSK